MSKYNTPVKDRVRLETWKALFNGYSPEKIAQLRIAFMPDENAFDAAVLIKLGASPENIVGISDAFPKDFAERPGKKAALTKKCGVSFRVFGGKLSESAIVFEEEGLYFDIAFLDFCGNVSQNGIRDQIEAFMFVMAPTARVAVNHLKGREMKIMPQIKKVGREPMIFASVNCRRVNGRLIPDAPVFNREPLVTGEYRNNSSPMAWYVWGRIDTRGKQYSRAYHHLVRCNRSRGKKQVRDSEYIERYRAANIEKINKRDCLYREKNRDEINKRKRLYGQKNRDKIKERNRLNYLANRDKINERCHLYYLANRDSICEWNRLYREANRDKISERRKAAAK